MIITLGNSKGSESLNVAPATFPSYFSPATFNFIDIFSHKALTDNGKDHYREIKHVPSQFKVVKAHGYQSNDGFYDENPGEDVV